MNNIYKITGRCLVLLVPALIFSNCVSETMGPIVTSPIHTLSTDELNVDQTITTPKTQTLPVLTQPAGNVLLSPATPSYLPSMDTLTKTPLPPEIAVLLPEECTQLLTYDKYPWVMNQCKQPVISPDGKYLAYVSLVIRKIDEKEMTASDDPIQVLDAVHVMEIDSGLVEEAQVVPHKLSKIYIFEWSSTGKLIFWESFWEGPGVLFVYDPDSKEILATMRTYKDTALQWNPQKTAFYATRKGGYGADSCLGELNGFDFQSNQPFPDMYEVFNIEKRSVGGTPYISLTNDSFDIEPFGWSEDGKRLWVTVTFLDWQGESMYGYQKRPRQAGVFELLETGVSYVSIASDEQYDYFFEGDSLNPEISSKIYQPEICPPP